MTSIGRRGSGSSIASEVQSDAGSWRSTNRLVLPAPAMMRHPPMAAPNNLSDVWVPADIQRVGTPSGSPLPSAPLTVVAPPAGLVPKQTSRMCATVSNVIGAVLTLGVFSGIFYGLFTWINRNRGKA